MSHLKVKKTPSGKFGIFNKNKGTFVGKPSGSKQQVTAATEKQDKTEDAQMKK